VALTADEITQYTEYLTAAEKAYHSLVLGGQARVFVDQNGERIEYTSANRASLLAYIQQLRDALGKGPFLAVSVCRPAGVYF
jgi:hypothetical protein